MAYTYFSKLILILTVLTSNIGLQQINNQWLPPQRIPNYEDTSRPPFIIADHDNRIHAFNYQTLNAVNNAIFYRQWTLKSGWTPPVDIILTGQGGGPATLQDVKLDQKGNFHIIFNISDLQSGNLYYSSAYIESASNSKSWTSPMLIGSQAGPFAYSNLTVADNDHLLVFYAGQISGTGLYFLHSDDGGRSWSQPLALSTTSQKNLSYGAIKALVDDNGSIHIVWSLINELGLGEEVHYARLNAQHDGLEAETTIARREGNDYSTTWPDIIRADDQLILFYQDSFPATRFMRISKDNGNTWSLPVQPFPYIGEYETTAMTKDSLGHIHLLLGNRTVDPEIHGMWYSQWLGNRWSTLSAITYGQKTAAFDPSVPKAVVLNGNLLFATWWNDTRVNDRTGAWYSYRMLDAPIITPQPYDTPSSSLIIDSSTTSPPLEVTDSVPSVLATQVPFSSKQTSFFPAGSVFLALIPVVGLVVLFYFFKKRQF